MKWPSLEIILLSHISLGMVNSSNGGRSGLLLSSYAFILHIARSPSSWVYDDQIKFIFRVYLFYKNWVSKKSFAYGIMKLRDAVLGSLKVSAPFKASVHNTLYQI